VPDRSPYSLAALACAAIRGLHPVTATSHPQLDQDVDAAVITDDLDREWVVKAPRTSTAAVRLDQESRLLSELTGWLPFSVPVIEGSAGIPDGGAAFVHRVMAGTPLSLQDLSPGPGRAAALGRAIAEIHELPERVVEDAGLAVYGVEEYRQRRLAEVDRAAGTGKVPTLLLERWEKALEEAGAWRFVPCVVHGDLIEEHVLLDGDEITGVLGWGEARVADPADDMAWLVSTCRDDVYDSVFEAYALGRRESPDPHLIRRARLSGELAFTRWLLHGITVDDDAIVDDAVTMVNDLAEAVADKPW
jgi:aminoglycoside phosphotransferase (APT) family kinase protein